MRVAFVTREPIVHQFGGSTTAALNLLEVLVASGCEVEVMVTSASSRSPRLFWRHQVALPAGVRLHAPGFFRFRNSVQTGRWEFNLLSARAWARLFLRVAQRFGGMTWLGLIVKISFGNSIIAEAWDLTPPEDPELTASLRFLAAYKPDIVVVNYAFWAPVLASNELLSTRRIVLMHDLLSARIARFRRAGLALDCPDISLATEVGWLNQAEIVLAIQETEAEQVRRLTSAEVLVQPIILRTSENTEGDLNVDRNRCLFVGTRIQPNQTGIQWFIDEVWPIVLKGNPIATLTIAGSVCEVLKPHHPGVELAGILDSLKPELQRAAVCVVPLLVGSGLKIKLVEALAHGKACVSTPIGVQGLEDVASDVIDVADEPAAFAAAVLRLMSDDALRQRREVAARNLVKRRFSPESAAARAFAARLVGERSRQPAD